MVNSSTTAALDELLPPRYRFALQVGQNAAVACLTLCVWDWLLSLSDELEMICHGRQLRRYLYDLLYFVVRICPIIYLITTIILTGDTAEDTCETLIILKEALNIVIMPAASALFFIRLRAVYSRNNYVTTFFGFWLLVILALFLFDSAKVIMQRSKIARSKRYWKAHYIDAWGYIATAAYDTLVYFSISWQLASFAVVDRWQDRLRLFVTGNGLGWLSKVLFQSGQVYYFMTIGFSLCTAIFIFNPATHSHWNAVFVPPNVTIASVMACRIFRELKLGLIVGPITETAISQLVFEDIGSIPEQHSGNSFDLPALNDAAATVSISPTREVWPNRSRTDQNIDLEDNRSRAHGD